MGAPTSLVPFVAFGCISHIDWKMQVSPDVLWTTQFADVELSSYQAYWIVFWHAQSPAHLVCLLRSERASVFVRERKRKRESTWPPQTFQNFEKRDEKAHLFCQPHSKAKLFHAYFYVYCFVNHCHSMHANNSLSSWSLFHQPHLYWKLTKQSGSILVSRHHVELTSASRFTKSCLVLHAECIRHGCCGQKINGKCWQSSLLPAFHDYRGVICIPSSKEYIYIPFLGKRYFSTMRFALQSNLRTAVQGWSQERQVLS